ncbi:hypothetical protein Bca4012_092001 [Brassica carinata]
MQRFICRLLLRLPIHCKDDEICIQTYQIRSLAIPLFWSAINVGDRVDSALKDMAMVMKQQDWAEETIKDSPLTGKRTKTAGSQGKKFQVSVEQEATRLLRNLGWDLMQRDNFVEAEDAYRRALSIAPDNNKMCNLGNCHIKQGRINEAKETLRLSVKPKAKPDLNNGGYGEENVKTNVNVNVVLNNPLRVDAKPFFSSKLINNKEKLKRTRSSSQTMGMLSFGGGDEGETNTKEKKAIDSG